MDKEVISAQIVGWYMIGHPNDAAMVGFLSYPMLAADQGSVSYGLERPSHRQCH